MLSFPLVLWQPYALHSALMNIEDLSCHPWNKEVFNWYKIMLFSFFLPKTCLSCLILLPLCMAAHTGSTSSQARTRYCVDAQLVPARPYCGAGQ